MDAPEHPLPETTETEPDVAPRGSSRHRATFVVAAALGALGLTAVVGVAGSHALDRAHAMLTSASLPTVNSVGSAVPVSGGSADPRASAAAVAPAVVDINTTLGYAGARAAGTGTVLTADGLVLTNNHVVQGATSISAVDVGNGRTYQASVVGYDKAHDVAVVQLAEASGLETASIGDSAALKVGDTVVGVGNAGGVGGQPSSAVGSVVGLNTGITAADEGSGDAEQLSGMIATDAPIQPGDSGGPLVDVGGRVVGMDTAGSSDSGPGATGFAVPISTALDIAHQIVSGDTSSGTVHVGGTSFLGIQAADGNGGVQVAGVVDGSAAATAGLAQGEVITAVDGRQVASASDLGSVLASTHPGDQVSLTWVDQDGQQSTATVQLGSGPAA